MNDLTRQVESLKSEIRNIKNLSDSGATSERRRRTSESQIQVIPHRRYTSIRIIPNLPEHPQTHGKSNISVLIKAFSYPYTQFTGSGSIQEKMGVHNQKYANLYRTFKVTRKKAHENLYILFKANSEAERYYHKRVPQNSKNLDEAFSMMYTRFMSEGRHDKLLQKWNSLKFSNFLTENMDRHTALRNLVATAPLIRL